MKYELSLDPKERDILRSLSLRHIDYSSGRNMSNEYRALIQRGLAVRSLNRIAITALGEEVLDRVS